MEEKKFILFNVNFCSENKSSAEKKDKNPSWDKRSENEINFHEYQKLVSSEKLVHSGKVERKDMKFFAKQQREISDKKYYYILDLKYVNYLFIRAVATDFLFINIDFSKTIFDSCYLKDCRFENCNFEGAKFMNCNLQGSYFQLCNFDYVLFEKTFVDDEIFECAPKRHNLKYKFARSLKLNYASIGDYIKASKAVKLEMQATKSHLLNSWLSGENWYNVKYRGFNKRFAQLLKYIKVSLLDFIWGNGESLIRLVRFNFLIFLLLAVNEVFKSPLTYGFIDFLHTLFIKVPANYVGIETSEFSKYPLGLRLILNILRIISFGLLMSIIIKKYNRR